MLKNKKKWFCINAFCLCWAWARETKQIVHWHSLGNKKYVVNIFRPGDPPEYNALYLIPASVFFGGYTWGIMNGLPEIHNFAALGSSLCCIGAIASLSSQKTARFGNNLGIVSILKHYSNNNTI